MPEPIDRLLEIVQESSATAASTEMANATATATAQANAAWSHRESALEVAGFQRDSLTEVCSL